MRKLLTVLLLAMIIFDILPFTVAADTALEVVWTEGSDYIRKFSNGLVLLSKYNEAEKTTSYGYYDIKGKEVFTSNPDMAEAIFSGGLAIDSNEVFPGEKFRFIDKTGKAVSPFIYDLTRELSGELAIGRNTLTHNWDFLDTTGNVVFSLATENYYDISYAGFSEGLLAVKNSSQRWGFIDKSGNEVIACKYGWADDFSEGLAVIQNTDSYGGVRYGYIDKTGEEIIPLMYREATSFSDGLARIRIVNGSISFIDRTGIEAFSYSSDNYDFEGYGSHFSEGLIKVRKYETPLKYGFLDKTGETAIPFIYDRTSIFCEGLAAVCKDGKWGYIDKTGEVIVPLIYDWAYEFSEGAAIVIKDGRCGILKNIYTITVFLNDKYIAFDQTPIIENGRTLVPLRAIFEAMGADVHWNDDTQTVTAEKDGITVSMQIDSNAMIKNDESITLDASAQLVNGRTLIPVRAVAESFGAKVDWDGDTQTVIITN